MRFRRFGWKIFFSFQVGMFFLSLGLGSLWARPLYLGAISTEPAQEIWNLLPLANYLSSELQWEGIDRVKIRIARNIPEMIALLKGKGVDFFIESPFPSMAMNRFTGSKILLRGWSEGSEKNISVLFTTPASGIKQLRQLKGKMIAFESPHSTFGYMLPKLLLSQKGYKLTPKKNFFDTVSPDEIGYLFSKEDKNTLLWVEKGRVSAGAVSDGSFRIEEKIGDQKLKVLEKTFALPALLVNSRRALPAKLTDRLKEVLQGMHLKEMNRKIFKDSRELTKFDELPPRALDVFQKIQDFIDLELKF